MTNHTLILSDAEEVALDAEVVASGQPLDLAHRNAILLTAIQQRLAGRVGKQAQDLKDVTLSKFNAAKSSDTKATILAASTPVK